MTAVARTATTTHGRYPLIVHSHLRWDFVWQRPQQILSRFGNSHPVLYVEEPVFLDDVAMSALDITNVGGRVYRVVPRLPGALRSSYDDAAELVRSLLIALISEGGRLAGMFDHAVQWFYTPMPAPVMLGAFGERGVVYDCMDELAQFRFAPAGLTDREYLLMARTDIVFTGGRALFESKSRYHPNVHFFGCGVDAAHFSRARHADTVVPPELRDLPRPVLGYFGVIDERLDYGLVDRLAECFAHGSVVFVGPMAKVDPAELPQRTNVHWLGQRPYATLPAYVKGFDVCLMPFALNAATEFINPTKTLEYMAAGKPIVSTPVPDVVRNFTPIVRVARTADDFAEAVSAALQPDTVRVEAGIDRAREATWESIVSAMDELVARAVRASRAEASIPDVVALRPAPAVTRGVTRPDLQDDDAANVA
jgi:glycosyltransferase involved in cell wall biosynthesis